MTYLLDTNVWVALLRGTSPLIAGRFRAATISADVRICSVIVAELWYGCARSTKPAANRTAVDILIAPFPSLPYTDVAAEHFVSIRRSLETRGQVIGPYDMQIAAIALANACALVTHYTGEFRRVPGLVIEDWEIL
jgi:tRNA(fMet)-specific endonuclease VapC